MSLLNRLERSLGRYAIPNLSLILVLGQVAIFGFVLLANFNLQRIELWPLAVLHGEPWRLLSFLLIPPPSYPALIAFSWYLFYLMGSALEGFWGDFRYNLFLFVGWALTVAAAFLNPNDFASNYYLFGTVFLAFAFLNPEFELLLFFILPVKIKWLALIQWLTYAFKFITGDRMDRLMILAAVGNFLLFFAQDLVQTIRSGKRRMDHQARVAAAREEENQPRHRCRICGKTELSHPNLDFRYCSKCAGDECYCSDHIATHEHTTAPTPPAS